jgi:hypothetical protein
VWRIRDVYTESWIRLFSIPDPQKKPKKWSGLFIPDPDPQQHIYFNPTLLLLFLDPRSGIDKNQDSGLRINIPDPQHWHQLSKSAVIQDSRSKNSNKREG